MRTLMLLAAVAILACTFSVSASAQSTDQWHSISNDAYVLKPSGNVKILLLAMIDHRINAVGIYLYDIGSIENICGKGVVGNNGAVGAVGPYKINGTFVRFTAFCAGGNEVYSPTSKAGRQYLNSLVAKSSIVKITIRGGLTLHYNTKGFSAVRKKILSTQNAL